MSGKELNKKYANESVVHTIKILEALQGVNFEPVSTKRVTERTKIPYDKCRRVLLTLELLGWAAQNDKKEWTLGARILRFSEDYSEICIAALHKN